MEKQRNHLSMARIAMGALHYIPLPWIKDFSHLFILFLSYFSYTYPNSILFHQFSLSSGSFSSIPKHATVSPIFQKCSLDLTLLVSHFSAFLYSETSNRSLFCPHFLISKSLLNPLYGEFSIKRILSKSPAIFILQIQCSILYPDLH